MNNFLEIQTLLFVAGEGGCHTYRIPALAVTTAGTLLAFCEGRKHARSDTGDIALLLKRSTDGGRTWSEQSVVWDDVGHTCGNPCPVVDRNPVGDRATGRIWLPMTWNRGDDHERQIVDGTSRDTRRVFLTHSDDDGRTWAPADPVGPIEITAAVKGGAKAVFIQGGRVDEQFAKGDLDRLRRWVQHIKSLRVPAGMASHRPDVHLEAEKRKFPTDFYFQCFYPG